VGTKATLLSFRLDVVSGIITKHHMAQRQRGGRPSGSGDMPNRLTERHFPTLVPPSATQENTKRERRVCGASKQDGQWIRKHTRYMCATCGAVARCVVPCFQRFHTLLHYEMTTQMSDCSL